MGASRLKKIFYTNARTAYAQSEARAGYKLPLSEYIRYVAILDNRTRHTHALLHGKIAHRKDKFWEKNYPPNGWNCRCAVEFISKDEMEEQGFKEMSEMEKTLNFAEKDWAYDTRNLSRDDENLQLIIKNKIEKYAKNTPAREALEEVKRQVIEQRKRYKAVKELWDKTTGSKDDKVSLGKISEFIKDIIGAQADDMSLNWQTIEYHRNPKIKRTNTHPEIGAFEYSIIPFMLSKSVVLGIYRDKKINEKNQNIYVVASKLNHTYRLALTKTPTHIEVSSLLSDKDTNEDILGNLKKKKKEIYVRSETR